MKLRSRGIHECKCYVSTRPNMIIDAMQARACVAFNKVEFDVQVVSAFDTFYTIDTQRGAISSSWSILAYMLFT